MPSISAGAYFACSEFRACAVDQKRHAPIVHAHGSRPPPQFGSVEGAGAFRLGACGRGCVAVLWLCATQEGFECPPWHARHRFATTGLGLCSRVPSNHIVTLTAGVIYCDLIKFNSSHRTFSVSCLIGHSCSQQRTVKYKYCT